MDSDLLEVIEKRVEKAEQQVFGKVGTQVQAESIGFANNSTCLTELQRIHNVLHSTKNEKLNKLMAKVNELSRYCSPNLVLRSDELSLAHKCELLTLESARIKGACEKLKQVDALNKTVLAPDAFPNLGELDDQLKRLYVRNAEQQLAAQDQLERTRRLVANYRAVIDSVNEQIEIWNEQLKAIENAGN